MALTYARPVCIIYCKEKMVKKRDLVKLLERNGVRFLRRGGNYEILSADFDSYRRADNMRTVRKNVTLPNYLNEMAMKAGISFFQVLQNGKERLGI